MLRVNPVYTLLGGDHHPLHFKPAPENLISKVASEPEGSGEEDVSGGEGAVGMYVPPRVVAMPYKEAAQQSTSMPKSQLRKSKLIRELRDEVTDFPTEVEVSKEGGPVPKNFPSPLNKQNSNKKWTTQA